ncbi:hypothetical protein L4C36_17915 [Photobacterium japonica]|uniref:DUF6916 family protein n=1 Tax=Photobacterium japonica TaxID=2910235 RepID=UPI003D0C7A21
MNPLSMKNAQKLIGETISLFDEQGREGHFIVDAVTPLARHGFDDIGRVIEHFVINFQGDGSSHFPDGHYHFKHPKLGEILLYVFHKTGHEYEIIVDSQLPD